MTGNQHELTVRYIADPMCAQCYGIAPFMDEVSAYCDRHGLGRRKQRLIGLPAHIASFI